MLPEIISLAETLEEQLKSFRELAGELVACRTAYVAMDLDAIFRHVATQAALCDKLRQIEKVRSASCQSAFEALGLPSAGNDIASWLPTLEPHVAARLRSALTELALTEGMIRRSIRVHRVLLDGSQRTLHVLVNALAVFSPTYTRPAAVPAIPAARTQP